MHIGIDTVTLKGQGFTPRVKAGDRVAGIGPDLPPGRLDLDVAGQVVTAGFIDIHSHAHDRGGQRLQAMDGVTTALELEAGITPVAAAYAAWSRGATEAPLSGVEQLELATRRLTELGRPLDAARCQLLLARRMREAALPGADELARSAARRCSTLGVGHLAARVPLAA